MASRSSPSPSSSHTGSTPSGWSTAEAYAHQGISGMNGLSDQQELTTTATWQNITNWAKSNGLSRLAFWSVNRDRQCSSGGASDSCSGVSQSAYAYTKIFAQYTG